MARARRPEAPDLSRRAFLEASLAALPLAALVGPFAATPECAEAADEKPVTPGVTEGPYWKAGSPERSNLVEEGMKGTRLRLRGRVVRTTGAAVPKAVLDVWQASADGAYDNAGFRLRGHFAADEQGRFELLTVVPGLYPGRTRHVHVKVRPDASPQARTLTTQLFFPDEPANRRDDIFRSALLMTVKDTPERKEAWFDFVLPA